MSAIRQRRFQQATTAAVWLSVGAAIMGFFLPWATIDLRASSALSGLTQDLGRVTVKIRRGTKTIAGELPRLSDIPQQVSGAQIPRLANRPNAQVAIALLELFTQQRQQIGLKSYAVYLLPGIALLCGVVVTRWGRHAVVALGSAILCAAIAGVGWWKLLTTDTQALFVAITIGPGLWLSLWAYVVLAPASGLYLFVRRRIDA